MDQTKCSRSRHWSPDSESSYENEYKIETEKQQRKRRKIAKDVTVDDLIIKYRKKVSELAKKIKSHDVCQCAIESNLFNDSKLNEKFVWAKKIERNVRSPMTYLNLNTILHLPLVVCDRELAEVWKKEALNRVAVCGEQLPAALLGEARGLHSSTEADVKNLLQGKSHSELEVLQFDIESQMHYGSANVVEYWEPILKHIHIYKAKAFLKEECNAKILHMNLEKDHISIRNQEVDAGYDGKNDQTWTEEAEGTGSSCSPELYGDETRYNFEMKTMGVMDEGDALSCNNDKVILQSQELWSPETFIIHNFTGVSCQLLLMLYRLMLQLLRMLNGEN